MSSRDNLGDRIKDYEKRDQNTFMKGIPLIIRLDGRSFSKYTKNFNRPFDDSMSDAMFETTKMLVKESNALLGYTQSDEITLVLHATDPKSELLFAGKEYKILSVLPSMASVTFYMAIKGMKDNLGESLSEKFPSFDCRAFSVPSKIEAWNSVLWRVQDAVRNSVSGLAHHHFSHKSLQGKKQNDMIEMLMEEKGIKWVDLPSKYKEGRFVRTEKVEKMSDEYGPQPVLTVRSVMTELTFDKKFGSIDNREEFLFDKTQPVFKEE